MRKSSVEEIRARFDLLVNRFSDLDRGQRTAVDGALALDLIARTASTVTPTARRLLDVGCGAGNFSLRLLQRLADIEITLIDLSGPMLDRAEQRLLAAGCRAVQRHQGDIRTIDLGTERFDIILAGAVLHHLRSEEEWLATFQHFHRALTPGGGLWIFDFVTHDHPAVQAVLWQRYGAYLEELGGPEYRAGIFAYIAEEDSPRSLVFQLDMLRQAGFPAVEVLHANTCFAAFGAIKVPPG
jgi:tRNA (cmo5U34)-methyltransferase